MAVDCEVGVGTCFDLYFPAVEGTEPRDAARPDMPEAPHGSETILLVEDEDAVRELAKLVLTNHGYRVLEARNGCLALERAKAYSGEIDLLLTDVVMPDMGGWHLSEELQRQKPRMKLLFMSGYIDDSVVREGVAEAMGSFIQKPFAPATLAQQVRGVLDAPLNHGS